MSWSVVALVVLVSTAWADDSPWGTPAPDSEPPASPDAPPPAEPAPSEPAPTGAPVAPAEAVPVVAPDAAPAADRGLAGGNVPGAFRISSAAGAGTGVALGQELLVGRTGGSHTSWLSARYHTGNATVAVAVPLAWYRTIGDRTTDVGNIQADLWFSREGRKNVRSIGVETHFALGSGAWTWGNRPDDLWPGAGVDIAMQWRSLPGKNTTVMRRFAVGAHGAQAYDPFPGFWVRFNAAIGVDRQLGSRFGLVGEASLQTWDMSPIDVSLMGRVDVIDGLRARAGLLLPVGVWIGLSPSGQSAGLSESTFLLDLSFSR